MTPESLDKWLQEFGENVAMKKKNGSKMCSVIKLRQYIKQAIEIAVQRDREGKTNEQDN
jgi:hypothetical protein